MQKVLSVKFLEDANVQQSALYAVIDAKKQNRENEGLYTQAEKQLAQEFMSKAQGAYIRSRCYLNYRENFIAVKVDKPTAADKLSAEVTELEKFAQRIGAVKKVRGTAIIYEVVKRK